MSTISQAFGDRLTWVQTEMFHRRFDIFDNRKSVGRIEWTTVLGSQAVAELGDDMYNMKKTGIFNRRIIVTKAQLDVDVATLELGMSGRGVLTYVDGHRYRFERPSVWRNIWRFTDENGVIICRINQKIGFARKGEILIEKDEKSRHYLPVMIIAGLYAIGLITDDAATAAAAGAGGS